MEKDADNEVECSIALSYLLGSKAPIITASGKGHIAERIREIAKKSGIAIIKNSDLANLLSHQEIGTCIPPEVYSAVAAIFAFLIRKKKL